MLISGYRDFLGRSAFHLMAAYFPTVSGDHLGTVLNGPVVTFNPETILFKAGQPHPSIYLLLAGQVEVLDDDSDFRAVLSAGALLGELTGLHGLPPTETCRALSFVQVLEIPADVYTAFVRRHALFGEISRLMEGREFLSRTRLLATWCHRHAERHRRRNAAGQPGRPPAGRDVAKARSACDRVGPGVLAAGRRRAGNHGPGDFFGEKTAVFDAPGIATLRTYGPVEIHRISASLLAAIPNVRWKLFESFERRTRLESSVTLSGRSLLVWQPDYSVNIQRIDTQHKRLLGTANRLIDAVECRRGDKEIALALDYLVNYAQVHFTEEEGLLRRYDYGYRDTHQRHHRELLDRIRQLAPRLDGGPQITAAELHDVLHAWIVEHIEADDRCYAVALNAHGVY